MQNSVMKWISFANTKNVEKNKKPHAQKSYFHSVFVTAILKLHSIIYKGP